MIEDFRWPEPDDPADEKLFSNVRQYGCHIMHIIEDEKGPEYSFSIGLYLNYSHPEIVIFGLDHKITNPTINRIASLIREGREFSDGQTSDELFEGLEVVFLSVERKYYGPYLGYANWFYQHLPQPFPVLQLVWPDKQGRFPWEKEFSPELHTRQPLLTDSQASAF